MIYFTDICLAMSGEYVRRIYVMPRPSGYSPMLTPPIQYLAYRGYIILYNLATLCLNGTLSSVDVIIGIYTLANLRYAHIDADPRGPGACRHQRPRRDGVHQGSGEAPV